jgi:hypothetical protein
MMYVLCAETTTDSEPVTTPLSFAGAVTAIPGPLIEQLSTFSAFQETTIESPECTLFVLADIEAVGSRTVTVTFLLIEPPVAV